MGLIERNRLQTKRIVCLANSRKLAGRYIAGREWDGSKAGAWIRPVSKREGQDVSEYERQYEDGSDPRPLDVVDVPVIERAVPERRCGRCALRPNRPSATALPSVV